MTKVTVRIHHPTGIEFKTKKIQEDGTILLRKKGKFDKGWMPTVDDLEIQNKWFGRIKYYCDIFPEAPSTFKMNLQEQDESKIQRPELSQKDVTRYAKSKVFEKRYMTDQKPVSSMLLYVILMIQIVSIVIMFLLTSGRLRI